MLYNSQDSKFSNFTKLLVFWTSLASMIALFIFILTSDTSLPQTQMTVEIDIKDKINICSPAPIIEERHAFNHKNYEF